MFTDIVGVTIVGVTMDKSRNSVFLLGGSLEQVSLTDSAYLQYSLILHIDIQGGSVCSPINRVYGFASTASQMGENRPIWFSPFSFHFSQNKGFLKIG